MIKHKIPKFVITGIMIIILLAGFFIFLFHNDALIYVTSVTIADSTGNKKTLTDQDSIDFYVSVTKHAHVFQELPLEASHYRIVTITYAKMSDINYTFYLSANSRNCFFYNPDGKLYNLNKGTAIALLERDEMFVAYDTAYPVLPTLKIGEKSYSPEVTGVAWKYKTISGTFHNSGAFTAGEGQTYTMQYPDTLEISFPMTPDYLETNIFRVENDGSEIDVTKNNDFNTDMLLHYVYKANWYEVPDCHYYGYVEYSFYVKYTTILSAAMIPSHEDDPYTATVKPGGTVFIRLFNAGNKKVTLHLGELSSAPTLYGSGNTRYLLIPISANMAEGVYHIGLEAGEYTLSMTVNVTKRSFASGGSLDPSRLGLSPAEYHSLFASFCQSLPSLAGQTADEPLWSGNGFSHPLGTNASFTISTTFNETITLAKSQTSYIHAAVDLVSNASNPMVYAASDGVVAYAGQTEYGGNTVIIDHGLGLRTVYCHLNTLSVFKGESIQAGDLLGELGKTGYVTGKHLHFSAFIGDTFIDPLLLFESDANGNLTYLAYFMGVE